MESQKDWLKFVISGSVKDYIKYTDSCKKERIFGGESVEFHNRCTGNKGNEIRGEGSNYNSNDP